MFFNLSNSDVQYNEAESRIEITEKRSRVEEKAVE
jgi:hypothetical protein